MPAETAARFEIRPFREGDEAAILELFARAFHHERSRAHFDWKYRQNPYGNDRISLAFDEEGALAGHYAGYVVPFRDHGADLLAHQIGDTMTATSVRHVGRGPTSVLGRTALAFYERFCEGRVAFNYGFNVANIQKFSLRFLRSDRVEGVPYRLRDLRLHPLAPLRRLERYAQGYSLAIVTETDGEFNELFERAAPAYGFLVRRDAKYLRWRYLQHPDLRYIVVAIRKWGRLAGWSVFRVRENRLSWGDALFDPRFAGAPAAMLRHVVPQFGVSAVEGWFPSRPAWFASVLEELGFELRVEPQDLSLMCVPFTMQDAVTRMRQELYYTMGDGDLF
jgi:hypothetical protein